MPAFRLATTSARDAARLFRPTLQRLWLPLLTLHVAELAFSQALAFLQEKAMARAENLLFIVVLIAWQLLFTAIWSAAYLVIVGRTMLDIADQRPDRGWFFHLTECFSQTLIETVRAWASVLRWAVVLILPGIFEFTRLYWAPFFAALDPEYDRGSIDALAGSRLLVKSRWWLTFSLAAIWIALPDGAGLIFESGDDRLLSNPIGVLTAVTASAALNLFCFGWAVAIFRKLRGNLRSESAILSV